MIIKRNIWVFVLLICVLFSCREQQDFTESSSAKLSFSTDTVQFDTVFSTIGSTTLSFRFYNPNDNAVKTSIQLGGGASSNYRLNVDGYKSSYIEDFEIRGNDSAYVFVEVTIDPQSSNSPLIVNDSIMFYTNGNEQKVKLVAFGQDVHLYTDSVIGTQTWLADKPYLIYNSVLIDSLETLTIEAGAQLHFHRESGMLVKGTLLAQGTLEAPIVFQGDRLEAAYDEIPGQWGAVGYDTAGNKVQLAGVHFLQGSVNNVMDYTVVKNSVMGIGIWTYTEQVNSHTLMLSNSIIQNVSFYGIVSLTSRLLVYNSIIANCGSHAILINLGGLCEVYHSTIANYLPSYYGSRSGAAVGLSNYYSYKGEVKPYPFKAIFANTIIDGNLPDEIIVDMFEYDDYQREYEFDHCMIKADTMSLDDETIYKNVIKIDSPDSLPRYINKEIGDYRLDTLSGAKDRGRIDYGLAFPYDFDGVSRVDDDAPDLGAFERVEGVTEEE